MFLSFCKGKEALSFARYVNCLDEISEARGWVWTGRRSVIDYLPAHRGPATMGTRALAVHSQ